MSGFNGDFDAVGRAKKLWRDLDEIEDEDELETQMEYGLDDDLYDDDGEDEEESFSSGVALTDWEIEELGSLDGGLDAEMGNQMYSGYGMSVDLDELTDEQKDSYEMGYGGGWTSNDWDEE